MKALAALIAIVLALAPGAQAAVVEGRISLTGELGGVRGLAPAITLQMPSPSLAGSVSLAPALAPSFAAPAPVLVPAAAPAAAVSAAPTTAVPAIRAEHVVDVPVACAERFAELRAAFDEKRPEEVLAATGDSGETSPGLGANTENRKPDTDEPPRPPGGKTLFGFTRPLALFLVAVVLAQVGIESQNAALPSLIAKIFGNISVAADMGVAASLADLVGTVLAPITSKRLGLKRGYLWSTGLRVATGGLIAGLLAANWLSLTGLMALLAADYTLYGISYTLEKSIPAVMVGQDQAKLEKYKAARQTAIEVVATIIPIATGALIATTGFLPALIAFPVAMVAAIVMVSMTLNIPKKIAGVAHFELPGPQKGSSLTYFKHLGKGVALVWRTPTLLYSLLAYALVYTPMQIVYWFLAPAFGLHLTANPATAAAVAGTITGLYSFGSIIGALIMVRSQRKERDAPQMRKSMLRWTAATAVGMLLFASLALPAWTWATLTLPALALLFFGIPETIARLKLESYFQSQAPKGAVDDSTAVLEGCASVMIAIGLWWAGKVLAGAHIAGFGWLMLAAAPLAIPLLILTWALARASRKLVP
ncbi:MAG: hypothetical protein HY923_01120 [Elusimicrobia bacterium]|nr:hypothetical protein [Elusimicrobiota bacterium]